MTMGKLARVIDVSGCADVDGVLNVSESNWDIEVLDAGVGHGCGVVHSGGYKALVRPDKQLAIGYVGGRFRANSHRAQLHTLDALVQAGDILPVSVSTWDNGAILAYQFRCPGLDVLVGPERRMVSPLLTLAFAYGSQLSDSAFFADFTWFCKNQGGQVATLNATSRVKHRGDVHGKFGDVLTTRIQELGGELKGRYDGMRRMTEKPLTGQALLSYFGEAIGCSKEEIAMAIVEEPEKLIGKAAKIPEILDCYRVDSAGAEGTVWQAYNAVTRYETHHDGRNEATRQKRMLLGDGSKIANHAWALAAKIAA